MEDETPKDKADNTKALFQSIFSQLTAGCGRFHCQNPSCASNEYTAALVPEVAVRTAIAILKQKKSSFKLCEKVEKIDFEKLRSLLAETSGALDLEKEIKKFSKTGNLEASFLKLERNAYNVASPILDFNKLFEIYELISQNPNGFELLAKTLNNACFEIENIGSRTILLSHPHLTIFFILSLNPAMSNPDNCNNFFTLVNWLNKTTPNNHSIKTALCDWLSLSSKEVMKRLCETTQQHITIEVLTRRPVKEAHIDLALEFLDQLYSANKRQKKVGYRAFCNDAINDEIMASRQLSLYVRGKAGPISLGKYFFIFSTAVKSKIIRHDYDIELAKQSRQAFFDSIFGSGKPPYLPIVVKRDAIVRETLTQLQRSPRGDLKRPLRVAFEGEYGLDEGGVQKEFFQLLIRKLFDPEYGMFVYNKDSRDFWFNKDTLEFHGEFELVGILIGLAIYNGVILDLRLPNVVYMKLLNAPVNSLLHLRAIDAELANGLQTLLAFEGDVRETYMRTFAVEYSLFGSVKTIDLKEGGRGIELTNENRREYVDLYVEYVLNKSVKNQFERFYAGFYSICDNPKFAWFNHKELELLVCGSTQLDFNALEKACRYQDGYTSSSPTIRLFWDVIHQLPDADKKMFLAFTTGSDRVPIRGLGDLVLTISRNGADQQRLPSAHTCFNHLLLPEYANKAVLSDRLRLAIENSEGFGLM